jgi:hypothetical protein
MLRIIAAVTRAGQGGLNKSLPELHYCDIKRAHASSCVTAHPSLTGLSGRRPNTNHIYPPTFELKISTSCM